MINLQKVSFDCPRSDIQIFVATHCCVESKQDEQNYQDWQLQLEPEEWGDDAVESPTIHFVGPLSLLSLLSCKARRRSLFPSLCRRQQAVELTGGSKSEKLVPEYPSSC